MSGSLLQNVAVVQDGIELDFQGDKCGKSYYIKRTCIQTWDCFFYDWHEGGWIQLRDYGGWHNRHDAKMVCYNHAVDKRLIKFLPTRLKFKLNPNIQGWAGVGAAASAVSSLGILGL